MAWYSRINKVLAAFFLSFLKKGPQFRTVALKSFIHYLYDEQSVSLATEALYTDSINGIPLDFAIRILLAKKVSCSPFLDEDVHDGIL
jgi:hypothetical protein